MGLPDLSKDMNEKACYRQVLSSGKGGRNTHLEGVMLASENAPQGLRTKIKGLL